jgi:NADPH2:quinone reductase
MGARVIATAGGPEKCAFCRDLGADLTIDYLSMDIANAVREATKGRGADVIYDPVGGEAFKSATACIANEGRLLAVGFAGGSWGKPDVGHMVQHNYSVMGVMPGGYDYAFKVSAHDQLLEHWSRGSLRAPVYKRIDFEHVPDAIDLLTQGSVMGKIAVVIGSNTDRH